MFDGRINQSGVVPKTKITPSKFHHQIQQVLDFDRIKFTFIFFLKPMKPVAVLQNPTLMSESTTEEKPYQRKQAALWVGGQMSPVSPPATFKEPSRTLWQNLPLFFFFCTFL